MNTNRACGCKSFNSCYLCEAEFGLSATEPALERIDQLDEQRIFCPLCRLLYDPFVHTRHICGQGEPFHGIELYPNFISVEEEQKVLEDLDKVPWDVSQSGRRKQSYGPNVNFKRRKVKLGSFQGFPIATKFIQDRFESAIASLRDYKTVEQSYIEYRASTGARIDAHVDDCWIWGERIVQVNLMSDSMLTLLPFTGDPYRYNLAEVSTYPKVMDDLSGRIQFNPFQSVVEPEVLRTVTAAGLRNCGSNNDVVKVKPFQVEPCDLKRVIRIPLPRRSLLLLYGNPRYNWEHCILRRDITTRRIVIAYRELTPTFLPKGPEENIGREILAKAQCFF